MGDQIISGTVTVLAALVGLATLAVLVGQNAKTTNVISSAGNAFTSALQAAEGPVTNSAYGGVNIGQINALG